ncbi:MAG: DNA-protecting protein DprA [Gammaproteobacteria bacterium]|nr:DNA-protecting protein DprA [Gammaproteobacteria bacterium]
MRDWIAFTLLPGVGSVKQHHLLTQFGTVEAIFSASRSQLEAAGLKPAAIDAITTPDEARIEQALEWAREEHNHILLRSDQLYPDLLRELDDAPPLLYLHGNAELLSMPQLAIVGSRNPSESGARSARDFARHLSNMGLTITSGLATGIDAAAHQGALDSRGLTVAVVGTGLDRVYPARNRELAHAIAEQGLLVSEFPLGTHPAKANFPRRNRIISGLSVGTLVVEAALQSGSLITARLAMEQGREVFAMPGSIHNPLSRGCHQLIRDGAKLVETGEHIIEELASLVSLSMRPNRESEPLAEEAVEIDKEYQELLQHIGYEPTAVDIAVERSGLTAEAVSSMLLLLELQGYVCSAPGGCYIRVQ